jgi:hypothetical protein
MSCQKLTDKIEETDNFGKNSFSEMSLTEKETYCTKLTESFEYRKIGGNFSRFMPISTPALQDERLQQVKTKTELMAWIKDNLSHTLFSSVEEAEDLYEEIEQLQKKLQKKFRAFDFDASSKDMTFFRDFMTKRVDENLVRLKRNISLTKSSHCETARDLCLAEVQAYQDKALIFCGVGALVGGCIGGPLVTGIVDIGCTILVNYEARKQREQCYATYRGCGAMVSSK